MSKTQQLRLGIDGMTCNNCALGVRKFLEKKGLQNVDVSFANAEATFETDETFSYEEIVSGIENFGFQVVDTTDLTPLEEKGWTDLEWKLLVCAIFTVPLFLAMFLPFPILHDATVQMLLCLPVFLIGANHFGISAFQSLKTGVPNMDVLIFIGSTAAFIYSLLGYTLSLGHDFMFWETAATIITLVLVGNLMEQRSVRQTTSAIRELYKLQPDKVKLVTYSANGDQIIKEISHKDIKVGQEFLVNLGDKIPTDGVVSWGEGAVNEAMMTGESLLMDKKVHSPLIGGTILKLGTLKMKATKVGKDTALSQIIHLVRKAQSNQPPIQKLADKISAVFVPTVLLIAIATFLVSYLVVEIGFQKSMLHSIAVLVVACPCAMGLATPTAVMVGLGRAAKNGILIKGGTTMETIAKTKTVVFDKTGTLTTGSFSLKQIETSISETEFKSILLGLEQYSTHPLAKAIVKAIEGDTKPLNMAEVREMKGLGIMGKDEKGNTYMAGSYSIAAEFTPESQHNVYVLKNGQFVGWIDMEDTLRPDAVQCVDDLREDNVRTLLVSGDNAEKTTYIANKIGITEFYASKLPKEKLDIIEEMNKNGVTVMVGDGINDAPALAKADIGMAMSSASQVAVDSADVVLINSNLRSLNKAIGISKHTVLTIKQNLFWAFFYNILAIPVAAVGLLNPMIAALAMAFSDVIVIGNSLRLKRKKIK